VDVDCTRQVNVLFVGRHILVDVERLSAVQDTNVSQASCCSHCSNYT